MDNKGECNQQKGIRDECTFSVETNNSSRILKNNLNNMDEIEKHIKKEEDNNQNIDNEDSLSYTTLYRSSQSSFNKNSKDIELSIQRRLSSNISTSQSDYQDLNCFSSDKQFHSQKSIKGIQPLNLFGNDLSSLVTNYYQETEAYLKNLNFKRTDYRRTKNYIEKEKYYDDYDEDNNDEIKYYKTIESSEEKNKIINENDITNNNSFLGFNREISNNNEKKPINDFNKIGNNNFYENKNNINITNINNNCFINPIFINPNNNFNNTNGSKNDVSMYYLGYYSVDCKS